MLSTDDLLAVCDDLGLAVAGRAPFRPLSVKLKVVYACNLSCEMCNHWRQRRARPLAMERWLDIVEELAGLGCRRLHLSGGEPLLRRDLPSLAARATALGMRVNLTTNGTLVDRPTARRLTEAGVRWVSVSIDSPERRVHDRIRGRRGSWKAATRAVGRLRREGRRGRLRVRVNTVVSRTSYRSLAGLPDLVAELGGEALELIPVAPHCGPHLLPSRRRILEYNREVAPRLAERALALGLISREEQAYPFGRTEAEVSRSRRGEHARGWYRDHPCHAPWLHSLIDFDGRVYVCCRTREAMAPLGDVSRSSFAEVWGGDAYARVRQCMHPARLGPCARCDDFLAVNREIEAVLGGLS